MDQPIYLDHNATTPLLPQVAQAMRDAMEVYGNPSSNHSLGRAAAALVERARRRVADLLGCTPQELIFTSGGTESNNLAICGLARLQANRGTHLVTTTVEHPAVDQVMSHLEAEGHEVTRVRVDSRGRVSPLEIAEAIGDRTVLVSVMHANNEVGTVMPLAEIAQVCRQRGVPLHTDAAQSVGKIPTRVDELGVDLLTVAGHKLHGPKGVGALYVRQGTALSRILHGADHERGLRPGTENVIGLAGLGEAAGVVAEDLSAHAERQRLLRDRLQRLLTEGLAPGQVSLNGHPTERLPNTLNLSFRGVEAAALLAAAPRVAASAGAACHSAAGGTSSVLEAMGVDPEYAQGAVRFSTGRGTAQEDVDQAAVHILEAVRSLAR